MTKNNDNSIKIILVGETDSGKTSIIKSFFGLKFEEKEISTSTASLLTKTIKVNGKEYYFDIWDTNGHEKFRSLTKIFLKGSNIVIFVYRIDVRKTFEEIDYWYKVVVDKLLKDQVILGLAGNFKDFFNKEEVSENEGKEKAEKIGAKFRLISAKTDRQGIEEFFQSLMEEYIKKFDDNNKGIKLKSKNNNLKNKSKCN